MNVLSPLANTATNFDNPWFQIPLLAFCVYAFASLAAWKFGFAVFKTGDGRRRTLVPWGLDVAFALLVVFSIVSPAICSITIKNVFSGCLPDFEENVVAQNNDPSLNDSAKELTSESGDSSERPEDAEQLEESEPTTQEETSLKDERDLSTQHPVARMFIRARDSRYFGLVFCVFVLSVVFVAPATEELIFRVVVQGACERLAFGRKLSDEKCDELTRGSSPGAVLLTIAPPAIIFAMLHANAPENPDSPLLVSQLFRQTLSSVFANLITATFAVVFLVKVFQANAADFGFGTDVEKTRGESPNVSRLKEFCRGATLYFYSAPVVYLVKLEFQTVAPGYVVDPAPILVFALWEGIVYYKTHSCLTVVGMHVALNFTSFLFLCMSIA